MASPSSPCRLIPRSVPELRYCDYRIDPRKLCDGGYGTIFKGHLLSSLSASSSPSRNSKAAVPPKHTIAAMKLFGYVSDKVRERERERERREDKNKIE